MTQPTFDVHSALAAMADYPAMLKRFGVIRTIEVDLAGSGIDPSQAGPVTVRATPAFTPKLPAAQVKVAPVQVPAYLSANRFAVTADGRVDPAAAKLKVAEIDTDSAGVRHVDMARQVFRGEVPEEETTVAGRNPIADLPDDLALPSLRNAGFSIFAKDRAVAFRDRLVAGKALHTASGPQTVGDAQQAVKGFVLDVWDDRTNRWHTVCAREATYKLPNGITVTDVDEGPISSGVTGKTDGGFQPTMYLHQSTVRWTGWSLVASRPGEVVMTEQTADDAPKKPTSPALPGFEASFAVRPGSLPRLRFGVGYRFQLRAVDITGHADPLDPTSTDFSHALPAQPIRYHRFDPVVAPVVLAAAPMTEGESINTLVVRPEPWLNGVVGSILAPILSTAPIRHLVPAQVSELLCEEHGRFDGPDGRPQAAKYAMIAQRDAANLSTVGTPDPHRTGQRYSSGASVPVTWLPEPLSRGAALSGLPGGVVKLPFSGTWPDLKSVRIQLVDGPGDPQWNPGTRVLAIRVPRGETFQTRLSSYVNAADLALLGQYGWLADSGVPTATLTAAQADITAGQAWQITPFTTLNLVNAVRVPVTPPVLSTLTQSDRQPGATNVVLPASASVHRPSTGHLSVRATWTDPVDNPADAGPTSVTSTTSPQVLVGAKPVADLAIPYGTAAAVDFSAVHGFSDTKRHVVDYSLVGTTRYMEYFVQRNKIGLPGTTAVKVAGSGIAPGTDVLRSVDGTVTYQRDVDYAVDYAAGTVQRIAAGAIPAGGIVEVAIVALPVSRPSPGTPKRLDIPSTARPAAPKVAWIVPTFGWTESSGRLTTTRVRHGGGLRIFLERPWYSSGTGERLAVILANGAPPANPDLLSRVTQLGADPAVVSSTPNQFPAPADFPLAVVRRGEVQSADVDGQKVAVAVHDVVWDDDRKRWACDVVLPPGTVYDPFVRLGLARYQGGSIAGLELSPMSTVEWVQLAPDRSATVTLDLVDFTKVTVTVAGRSAQGTAAAPGQPNRVSVIVQQTSLGKSGDLDWTVVGPADGQPLNAATQPDGTVLWTGTLRLPTVRLLKTYRIVITETERFEGGGRLVYSDVVRI